MDITTTFEPVTRAAWRAWLAEHGENAREIWLVRGTDDPVTYLDTVEEALCFGWIDGIEKRVPDDARRRIAQRFTPRRKGSSWTELNKERARRLIALGRMTDAGRRVLPDLDPASFVFPPDVVAALREAGAWSTFQSFPPLYQRIRAAWVDEERRRPEEHARRLARLVEQTRAGKMFGRWDDAEMPRTPGSDQPQRAAR